MSNEGFQQLQGIYTNRVERDQVHQSRNQKQTLSQSKKKHKTTSNTLLKKLPSLVKIPLQAQPAGGLDYSGPYASQIKT